MSARVDVVTSPFATGFISLAGDSASHDPHVLALRAHATRAFADLRELLRDVYAHAHAQGWDAPSIAALAAIAHAQVALLIRDALVITGGMSNPFGGIAASFVVTASSESAGRFSFTASSQDAELQALFQIIGLHATDADKFNAGCFTWPPLGISAKWRPRADGPVVEIEVWER